jgi:FkbM family methyltransferase
MYRVFELSEKVFAYLQGKGYGAKTTTQEVKLALQLLGRAPKWVVDVGANQGEWTEALLSHYPGTNVHAFEPQPVCARRLQERHASKPNVTIHQNAVSDSRATIPLYFDHEGSGLASLSKRNVEYMGIDFSRSIQVQTIVLDDFLEAELREQVDILKVDVEGHEMAVFRGLEKTFAGSSAPAVIQFEFGGCNIDTRTFFQDFFFLFNERYSIYRQTPFGLGKMQRYREIDECFRTTNFFLKLREA